MDWPEAAILTGDGLGVPARASGRLGDTRGKKVLVIGLGPVGLSNVLVQSFRGAEVFGCDLVPYRVKLAETLGASRGLNGGDESFKQEILDWTEGKGPDIVILAVGNNQALLQAVDLVRYRGKIYQVGEIHEATFNPSAAFIRKEVTWTGSWYYTSGDWETMLLLHESGLSLSNLITHRYPFQSAQEAYDTFISGESGKVILTYSS